MYRLWTATLAVVCAFSLLGAAAPSSILGTPKLLVYPFAVNGGDVNREAGSRLAIAIATQIANLGGVIVKPAPPGVERSDYLTAARREGVDYYIAGYITPLGDGVSLVEQLVSTLTGIVVYSNTAQINTYADAAGQGDALRLALIEHQTRNLGAYAAQPPPVAAASPTPAPGTGASANISKLFGRRQKRSAATPGPSPTPALVASPSATAAIAVATTSAPGYGLLPVGGTATNDRRVYTDAALRNVFSAAHQRLERTAGAPAQACSQARVGTLLSANLATATHPVLGTPETSATLDLLAYDCAGSIVYHHTFAYDGSSWQSAVNRVVQTAIAAFLHDGAAHRT